MSEAPLKATLKAGRDFDAPWLTVDGNNPDDLREKLSYIASNGTLDALSDAAAALKAAYTLQQGGAKPEQAQPQQSNGWGQQAAPQQQGQPQVAQVRLHPDGKTCNCGRTLEYKDVTRKSDNKSFQFWACPAQSKRGDGHDSEFAN